MPTKQMQMSNSGTHLMGAQASGCCHCQFLSPTSGRTCTFFSIIISLCQWMKWDAILFFYFCKQDHIFWKLGFWRKYALPDFFSSIIWSYFPWKKMNLSIKNLHIQGVPVRLYQPKSPHTTRKGVIHIHGGGGMMGSIGNACWRDEGCLCTLLQEILQIAENQKAGGNTGGHLVWWFVMLAIRLPLHAKPTSQMPCGKKNGT